MAPPAPILAACDLSAAIGTVIRRAKTRLAAIDATSARANNQAVRAIDAFTGANASSSGCSTKTAQPVEGIFSKAVSTALPLALRAVIADPVVVASPRAACTCGSDDRSVRRSTALMSGCAMSRPAESTTNAYPASPTLIDDTGSRTKRRFTSAIVTAASLPSGRATRKCGSDPARKSTGP